MEDIGSTFTYYILFNQLFPLNYDYGKTNTTLFPYCVILFYINIDMAKNHVPQIVDSWPK